MNSQNFEFFHTGEIFDEFPFVLVLLHGKRFFSKTWDDIGTTKFLSDRKISWLTIDLPGMIIKILLIKTYITLTRSLRKNMRIRIGIFSKIINILICRFEGFGKSSHMKEVDSTGASDFLLQNFARKEALSIKKLILVSPSMSGRFSIPFIMNSPENVAGYIPVAPITVFDYSIEKFASIKTKTLSGIYRLFLIYVKYLSFYTMIEEYK